MGYDSGEENVSTGLSSASSVYEQQKENEGKYQEQLSFSSAQRWGDVML